MKQVRNPFREASREVVVSLHRLDKLERQVQSQQIKVHTNLARRIKWRILVRRVRDIWETYFNRTAS